MGLICTVWIVCSNKRNRFFWVLVQRHTPMPQLVWTCTLHEMSVFCCGAVNMLQTLLVSIKANWDILKNFCPINGNLFTSTILKIFLSECSDVLCLLEKLNLTWNVSLCGTDQRLLFLAGWSTMARRTAWTPRAWPSCSGPRCCGQRRRCGTWRCTWSTRTR